MHESSVLFTKVMMAISGLLGAFFISIFWTPKALKKHSQRAQGAIICGIGVFSALTLGGFAMNRLGLDQNQIDNASAVCAIIGMLSVGFINFIANFFDKRQDKDFMEVVREVKGKK